MIHHMNRYKQGVKGGLTSEGFTILKRMCQVTILSIIYLPKESQISDLAHFLKSQREKLGGIKPPLSV